MTTASLVKIDLESLKPTAESFGVATREQVLIYLGYNVTDRYLDDIASGERLESMFDMGWADFEEDFYRHVWEDDALSDEQKKDTAMRYVQDHTSQYRPDIRVFNFLKTLSDDERRELVEEARFLNNINNDERLDWLSLIAPEHAGGVVAAMRAEAEERKAWRDACEADRASKSAIDPEFKKMMSGMTEAELVALLAEAKAILAEASAEG